jgi:hypothetical protein
MNNMHDELIKANSLIGKLSEELIMIKEQINNITSTMTHSFDEAK